MAALQKALDDCLIDFDHRVLVTDLLEQYKLTYKEVHETLEAHIKQQEQRDTKYDKRYLVHGTKSEANGITSELYTIVQGESKLKEWLRKLQNAESTLYSVEVSGGSKPAAPIFKPMRHIEVKLATVTKRIASPAAKSAPPLTNGVHKPAATAEPTKPIKETTTNVKVEAAPASEQKKVVTPTDQKKGATPDQKKTQAVAKKGTINSFFSAGPAPKKQVASPASNEKQTKSSTVKEKETKPVNGSMDSFFTKQPPTQSKKSELNSVQAAPATSPANTSVQLFREDSDSSDEEEKIDRLRRAVVNSDKESDADDDKPTSSKRRRIVDSDDEEQPQKKTEVNQMETDIVANSDDDDVEMVQAKSETYLDEDGFIVTIKAKKPTKTLAKKKTPPKEPAKKKTPPTTKKGSNKPANTPAATAAKTKQGSITSFFSKK